jgi:hypothetical protein
MLTQLERTRYTATLYVIVGSDGIYARKRPLLLCVLCGIDNTKKFVLYSAMICSLLEEVYPYVYLVPLIPVYIYS